MNMIIGIPRHLKPERREYMRRWLAAHPGYRRSRYLLNKNRLDIMKLILVGIASAIVAALLCWSALTTAKAIAAHQQRQIESVTE